MRLLILGWAFKKNTNDSRESAAIYVADNLLNNKINVGVYDPKVENVQIQSDLKSINNKYTENIKFKRPPFDELINYNIIAIMTEWDEFINYDWKNIYNKMSKPAYIFDGRNILNDRLLKEIGFIYYAIGRK